MNKPYKFKIGRTTREPGRKRCYFKLDDIMQELSASLDVPDPNKVYQIVSSILEEYQTGKIMEELCYLLNQKYQGLQLDPWEPLLQNDPNETNELING